MKKVEKTITVNAPAEKIYNYVGNPENLPEVWPSLVEVTDVQSLPNGGNSNRWAYKMAGIRLKGTSEDTERVPNERIVSKTKGGVESTQTWVVQPEAGGTKVSFVVEYTVPIPVLGKIAEVIIVKMNDREAGSMLANLKLRMEE
jgi:uncharacterized membrane protein